MPKPVDVLHVKTQPDPQAVRLRTARIESVALTRATITLGGGTVTDVPFLKGYTPVVGENAMVLQTVSQLIIIGATQ